MTIPIDETADVQVMLDDFGVSVDIQDGSDPANEVEMLVLGGELKFRETSGKVFVVNRGSLLEVLETAAAPVEVEFDLRFRGLVSSGQAPTPYEALKHIGAASGWTSTRPADEAYTVDVVFTLADPGGGAGEIITFGDFTPERIRFTTGNEVDRLAVSGRAFTVDIEKEGT